MTTVADMTRIPVQVRTDFLQRLSNVSPLLAIEELIWNSLDADATEVRVAFELSEMGSVIGVRVEDDGSGIPHADVAHVFGNLGGSWKSSSYRSKTKGRFLHGKAGRGRLRSFKLGQRIEWRTRYEKGLLADEYAVFGDLSHLETFLVSTPRTSSESLGTSVLVSDVTANLSTLLSDTARETLTQHLAPYLIDYPDACVWYNGVQIDPTAAIRDKADVGLGPVSLSSGSAVDVALSIFEWKASTSPTFVLCDENGFPRHSIKAGMPGLGFDFTAYVKSTALRQLDEDNILPLEEMDVDIQRLVECAKEAVREHFLKKTAQASINFVDRWKREKVYPFTGTAKSPVERAERQVFDVLALSLNTYLPGFQKADKKQQQFAMRLLKHAVETGPNEVLTIMRDVLDLPTEQQVEMTRLLQKTTLTAIINAAKVVADRQNFLRGLEILLYDPETKGKLLERKQLHKIIENETWIFGEEYHMTVSDKGLSEVLEKHLHLLGSRDDDSGNLTPVTLPDGSRGIVDLMLSRRVPQPDPQKREHLIVELKRPSKKIDDLVLLQTEAYAMSVAGDERFKDTGTQWTFWALSNDINDSARRKSNQSNRPAGIVYQDDSIKVWVKTWGQIIESCQARLSFYEKELKYDVDDASALEYLHRTHSKYLPTNLKPDDLGPLPQPDTVSP